jgi:hypothetical protein
MLRLTRSSLLIQSLEETLLASLDKGRSDHGLVLIRAANISREPLASDVSARKALCVKWSSISDGIDRN